MATPTDEAHLATDAAAGLEPHPSELLRHNFRVVIVSEGSGGHLVPALELARALAQDGSLVELLYPTREPASRFLEELLGRAADEGVRLRAIQASLARRGFGRQLERARLAHRLWSQSHRWLREFQPHAVVGFGGWVSIPVAVAARQRRIPILIHEQNAQPGKANRWLASFADRVALSFPPPDARRLGPRRVLTGLPVRRSIGLADRAQAAERLGIDPARFTVLALGGSQGSRAVNGLVEGLLADLTSQERGAWQFVHVAGPSEAGDLEAAYAAAGVRAFVAAHVTDMDLAYAAADLVIARAGASTLAELARCGRPAIFIPYRYAGGHQRENARLAERAGGALVLEERDATSSQLLGLVRRLQADPQGRHRMGEQMRALSSPDSLGRLVQEVRTLAMSAADLEVPG